MALYAPGAVFDDRRNTSRTFQPQPGAVDQALRACADLRRRDPRLVAWIEDGHPTLTEQEHVDRFGKPYKRGQA